MNHIIKKQRINLKVDLPDRDALLLQKRVSRLYHDKIADLIGKIFDRYGGDQDKIYTINELKLDIGYIDPDNLEKEFIQKLSYALSYALKAHINLSDSDKKDFIPKSPKQALSDISVKNKKESLFNLFCYFIKKGSFPWWAQKEAISEHELKKVIQGSPQKVKSFISEILTEKRYCTRLIHQFSDDTINSIIFLFTPDMSEFIGKYQQFLLNITKKASNADIRLNVWLAVFEACIYSGFADKDSIVKQTLLYLSENSKVPYTRLYNIISNIISGHAQTKKNSFKQEILKIISSQNYIYDHGLNNKPVNKKGKKLNKIKEADIKKRSADNLGSPKYHNYSKAFSFKQEGVKHLKGKEKGLSETEQTKSINAFLKDGLIAKEELSDIDEIYINNSGLMLLWPFIPNLFENIGLTKENIFIDRHKTERAALLLQYLADGGNLAKTSEHLLPLNKIMCGISLQDPIPATIELTKTELLEAKYILKAVIKHWSALKNMSVKRFRYMFIHREGVLTVRDGMWTLSVKSLPYDVLLDKIPWAVNIIKMPWLKDIIYLQWQRY